ncbi:hypothetical protein LDENG_00265660 [Lucifuga dentata]|nr:hypothetical protein LDENG_00265660 [Lucifuga dentata]
MSEFGLEVPKSKWKIPSKVIENGRAKILWNFKFQTNKQVLANQPDMVVVIKEQKRAVMINVAIPSDGNIKKKEQGLNRRIGLNVEGEVHSGPSNNRSTRGYDPQNGRVAPADSRNNI